MSNIYVMSDLHGCYKQYRQMLDKINFSQNDELYIIGDVIDRGEHGIKIMQDILRLQHVGYKITLLIGNHEFIASQILSVFSLPITLNYPIGEELQELLNMWILDGGKPTLTEFVKLCAQEQNQIYELLQSLPLCHELQIDGKDYILVHAGFENFTPERRLDKYDENELLFVRAELDTKYYDDRTVIVGHTPTISYGEEYAKKMFISKQLINIDCGVAYNQSGVLGCLRLNDFEEFYV